MWSVSNVLVVARPHVCTHGLDFSAPVSTVLRQIHHIISNLTWDWRFTNKSVPFSLKKAQRSVRCGLGFSFDLFMRGFLARVVEQHAREHCWLFLAHTTLRIRPKVSGNVTPCPEGLDVQTQQRFPHT